MTKKCIKCKKEKKIDSFYKNPNCKIDGHLNYCKKCVLKKQKKYRKNHKNKIHKYSIKYRILNLKEIKRKDKIYSQTNRGKEVRRKNRLKWIKNHPEKNIEEKKKRKINNKHKVKEYYEKNKMKKCKNCKYWIRSPYDIEHNIDSDFCSCSCEKFDIGYSHDAPIDGANIEGDEGWGIETGAEFGCINFKKK